MAHVELDPFLKLVIRMGRQGGPVYADHNQSHGLFFPYQLLATAICSHSRIARLGSFLFRLRPPLLGGSIPKAMLHTPMNM